MSGFDQLADALEKHKEVLELQIKYSDHTGHHAESLRLLLELERLVVAGVIQHHDYVEYVIKKHKKWKDYPDPYSEMEKELDE